MNRVEMMDALAEFNAALKAGTIQVQSAATDPKFFFMPIALVERQTV